MKTYRNYFSTTQTVGQFNQLENSFQYMCMC